MTQENPVLQKYPVLPLRDIVVFPHMIVPLFVGRVLTQGTMAEIRRNEAVIEAYLGTRRQKTAAQARR